ncbi:hypothetical protein GCM10020367_53550 [Streptomyces sannanensis]|uniref:Uncharacterized protein n=1 Tax=Streptomyces sannanensis TaxID=285536 RepID=A0ABP6SIZ0_9ACTN
MRFQPAREWVQVDGSANRGEPPVTWACEQVDVRVRVPRQVGEVPHPQCLGDAQYHFEAWRLQLAVLDALHPRWGHPDESGEELAGHAAAFAEEYMRWPNAIGSAYGSGVASGDRTALPLSSQLDTVRLCLEALCGWGS